MTDAVLFDVDGALLRLDVDIEEVRMRLAGLFGPLGVTRPFRPLLGRTRAAAREALGGDPVELLRRGFAIIDEWEVAAADRARGRNGVGEVLATLFARGVLLGLVTDHGRACLGPALAAAGLDARWFGVVVTRDDVAAGKPDPSAIVMAVRGLAGSNQLYVCAHADDAGSARAARDQVPGLRIAAFRGPHASEDRLRAAGADVVIGEAAEILALAGAD